MKSWLKCSIRVAIDEAIYDETVTPEAVIVHDSVESIQKVYMYIQWHSLCRILLCLELLFACPCHEILVNANAYWYYGILFCTELYRVEKNNQNLLANINLSWFYVLSWGQKPPNASNLSQFCYIQKLSVRFIKCSWLLIYGYRSIQDPWYLLEPLEYWRSLHCTCNAFFLKIN